MNNNEENKKNSSFSAPPSDMLSLLGKENDIKTNELPKADNNLISTENDSNKQNVNFDNLMKDVVSPKVELEKKTKKQNKLFLGVVISSAAFFILVLVIAVVAKSNIFAFRGNSVYYQNKTIENVEYNQTVVVTDNIYEGVTVNNESDAKGLIVKDSNNQKVKCSNENTKKIEKEIEEKYGIVAVNLCEVSYDFAKEIESVIGIIYKEFPKIKGKLTNITLTNVEEGTNYIASFVAARLFAKSNTKNTYPNVYKMLIFLNAEYYLDEDYLQRAIFNSVDTGYFPQNATKNTIIAHEMGHYLSFLAQLNYYKSLDSLILLTKSNYSKYKKLIDDSNNGVFSQKIINEAFNSYRSKKPNDFGTVYSFRKSISEYAVVKDDHGDYLYDETIAEAFHDYYINRDNAKGASKEIVKVLKKYLNS